MSTSQVNISCQHLMSIFQLDFPFLMPSISQYLEFNIYDCYFWVGFPISAVKYFSIFQIVHSRLYFWVGFSVSAVKYFSIFGILYLRLLFWVGFPASAVEYFSKFGIMHLRLCFWVGFPVSAVKYFSLFEIHDCHFEKMKAIRYFL